MRPGFCPCSVYKSAGNCSAGRFRTYVLIIRAASQSEVVSSGRDGDKAGHSDSDSG